MSSCFWMLSGGGELPKPTRDQLLTASLHFGGQSVTLPGLGTVPWFDAALQTLDASGRQAVYAMKRAAGDQVVMLTLWWAYQGIYTYPVNSGQGLDLSDRLIGWPTYQGLIREAILNGFYVELKLACEGQHRVNGQLGYEWVANVPALLEFLRDELPWCVVSLGFELLGPGGDWTPQQIEDAHLLVRDAAPTAVIALELGQGYNKWQEDGEACWASPAGQAIDIFQQEMPQPVHAEDHWQGCQILSRRNLGSNYTGPADPTDPHPPWYFRSGTPRGPHAVWCYEYGLYDWVRGDVSREQYEADRAAFRSWGYEVVG